MADAENALPPSKKRVAGRQLSRDNPGLDDDEEGTEQETGTFKKASDEVLANRRIVKVRRNQTSSAPAAPSSNPFASIRLVPPTNSAITQPPPAPAVTAPSSNPFASIHLVPPTDSAITQPPPPVPAAAETQKTISEEAESKIGENKETEAETKDNNDKQSESKVDEPEVDSTADKEKNETINEVPQSKLTEATVEEGEVKKDIEEKEEGEGKKDTEEKESEGESGEKNKEATPFSSFQQLSSGQNAFTGLAGSGFSSSTFSFGSIGSNSSSLFGVKSDPPSIPSFGFSNNENSSLTGSKSEGSGIPSMQEVPIETGEENEKSVFASDSVLFEFFNGGWKERGKGEVKVNVSTNSMGKARLVMRSKGNYRLILNASLYPDMKLTNMEKRGITFACVNSTGEGQDGLSTFALKFKDSSIVDEFRVAVNENKGESAATVSLKTPENSPKASDE